MNRAKPTLIFGGASMHPSWKPDINFDHFHYGQRPTLVNVASHCGQALEDTASVSCRKIPAKGYCIQTGHRMKLGSSLMSLEIGLSCKDFVTAIDLAWPRASVRLLLDDRPFLGRFEAFFRL